MAVAMRANRTENCAKAVLLAGFSVASFCGQFALAQQATGFGVTNGAQAQMQTQMQTQTQIQSQTQLARVYTSQTVGTLPNGMIAITLPTQIMVNGTVQILTPEYRVLTLPGGSFTVQGDTVYAQPGALQAIGYPVPNQFLTGNSNLNSAFGTQRKVLGFVPSAGTTFYPDNRDSTYGTQGLRVTEYECSGTTTTTLANLSGDVSFDTNRATLKPAAQTELNALASRMLQGSGARFTITGHTDSRGAESYNQGLSESRAKAVVDYLASQGVARDSMSAVGAGETQPIASNDTTDGQAQNRRVTVTSTGGTQANTVRTCTRAETSIPANVPEQLPTTQTIFQPTPVLPPQAIPQQAFAPVVDTGMTFIQGSQGVQGPPAVYIGAAQDSFVAGPIPVLSTSGSDANDFAAVTSGNDDAGFFGGVGQSVQDVPWFIWASGAAVAGLVGLLVLNRNSQ